MRVRGVQRRGVQRRGVRRRGVGVRARRGEERTGEKADDTHGYMNWIFSLFGISLCFLWS